jgi:type III secretion protein L
MVFIVRDMEQLSRPQPMGKILKARDFRAVLDARETMARARRRHDEIIATAQSARDAEMERGYREGSDSARLEQAGNMLEVVSNTVRYFARVEQNMTDLVLESVSRIVDGFDDRAKTLAVVKSALALVQGQKHLVLRVHPNRLAALRGELEVLRENYTVATNLDIVADSQLPEDACVVETEIGTVRTSTSSQMGLLRETFKNVFGTAA